MKKRRNFLLIVCASVASCSAPCRDETSLDKNTFNKYKELRVYDLIKLHRKEKTCLKKPLESNIGYIIAWRGRSGFDDFLNYARKDDFYLLRQIDTINWYGGGYDFCKDNNRIISNKIFGENRINYLCSRKKKGGIPNKLSIEVSNNPFR